MDGDHAADEHRDLAVALEPVVRLLDLRRPHVDWCCDVEELQAPTTPECTSYHEPSIVPLIRPAATTPSAVSGDGRTPAGSAISKLRDSITTLGRIGTHAHDSAISEDARQADASPMKCELSFDDCFPMEASTSTAGQRYLQRACSGDGGGSVGQRARCSECGSGST